MEPILKAFRELPRRFATLAPGLRMLLVLGTLGVAGAIIGISAFNSSAAYEYAFTNLTPEDSTEAGAALKAANIPFKSEAGGSAISVPASKVHDARLLLAAAGLPRGGGVGFELFDRGDLGASEFTQRINLRRATEGELSRTIGRLSAVRSARVHLTLPERGLFREEDRKASAAVVLNLQPGRLVNERELAGIRHLVASAVAGLDAEKVAVVDQRGTVLSGDRSENAKLASQQHEVESGLEQRIVELLEPAIGRGAVVAKVTATLDTSEVETTSDDYNGDQATVRSERKTTELVTNEGSSPSGVAGAAANQPLGATQTAGASGNRAQTSREDELKNYEIPKKTTRTVTRVPRVSRVSAAVLVDGVDGKPRGEAEMRRLAELAKHAVGFDAARGDKFDISSAPFAKVEGGSGPTPIWARPDLQRMVSTGAIALVALAGVFFLLTRAMRRPPMSSVELLKPGASVAEIEAATPRRELPAVPGGAASAAQIADTTGALRERARELGKTDPNKAAHLLKAWIASDGEARG